MNKLRYSLVFKVALIIIIMQGIILLFVASLIQNNQNKLVNKVDLQQEHFIKQFIERQKSKSTTEAFKDLNVIINVIKDEATYSLFNFNEEGIKKVLKSLFIKDDIQSAYIYDNLSDSVFMGAYKDNNGNIILTKDLPKSKTTYSSIKKELFYDGNKIGYVEVYYDMSDILDNLDYQQQKELQMVTKNFNQTQKELHANQRKSIVYFIITSFLVTLTVIIVLFKLVNKPLKEIKDGLERFFEFLSNPKKRISKISIHSKDEFGEIADFTNKGIKISAKLHRELAELMNVVDKYVIISETDANGVLVSLTEAFCDISGYTRDELISKSFFSSKYFSDENDYEKILNVLKAEKFWQGELKFIKKDKSCFWTYSTITKKCSANGGCNYIMISYNITSKKEVEHLKDNLELIVEEKTKEVKSLHKMTKESIEYASLIQHSLIPSGELFKKYFKNSFRIWLPKDIVGGDIYLFDELRNEDECLLMVIDCTGHGVPGAFMSILVKAMERQIITQINLNKDDISPANILSVFNRYIKQILGQDNENSVSNAGFDGGIIYYNRKEQILKYAGANVPLFYIKDNELKMIKGDRYSVGYKKCRMDYNYTEEIISLKENMKFYITTDGYLDQNGGKKGFPFGKKQFKKIIEENHKKSFSIQEKVFIEEIKKYQGDEDRNDDITIISFEV